MAPRARFELATLRLTAERDKNLSAASGVAYIRLGAILPLLAAPNLAPKSIRNQHTTADALCPTTPFLELPVRQPAARTRRSFWGVVAAPKSYRARVGIDLCSNFNEVAFRVTHHRFVVSVSSYPRTSSYGHSGCAHGSYAESYKVKHLKAKAEKLGY